MNSEKLAEILNKIPVGLAALVVLLILGWQFYEFTETPESPLRQAQTQIAKVTAENDKLKKKLKEAQEFYASLDRKRVEIREIAVKLNQMKSSLSEEVDVPGFVRQVMAEAKKVGLVVAGLKPEKQVKKEYYVEFPFTLTFRGVYVQLVVFLKRLSDMKRIVRIGDLAVKPAGSQTAKYVDIDGQLQVLTYIYAGSQADEIAKKSQGKPGG